jgi:lipid-A-disaccharide synthase
VDHVLCIFPFEPELLKSHGIEATFVGHPLASVIPMRPDRLAAKKSLGLDVDRPVLALMPGSRASEIKSLAHRFLQTSRLLSALHPGLQVVLPVAPGLQPLLDQVLQEMGPLPGLTLLQGQSHTALAACDVVLVASGTATLEAALFKRPMVIAYHMHALSWWLTRRQQLQPWVGLPNILAREFLVPEFLQNQAQPEAMCSALNDWLTKPSKVERLQQRFDEIHLSLKQDTAVSCADAIQKVLAR